MVFIMISREAGSFGEEIAEKLAERLNIKLVSRLVAMNEWFPEIADKHELHMLGESPGFFLKKSKLGISYAEYLEKRLKDLVSQESAIIFGLGSQIIFAENPEAIHVKIMASPEIRSKRLSKLHRLSEGDAKRLLELTDRKHRRYVSTIYNQNWADSTHYNIILNTDFLSVDECVDLLQFLFEKKLASVYSKQEALEEATRAGQHGEKAAKPIVYKNSSEEEFAKILDMYGLEWEYEPHTFPVEWDSEGNVSLAISPDFYLPRFNTYIELTTMNQKYVSKKKKKVRKLKELYPDININIVYRNDFYALMKRFGIQKGTDDNES